MLPTKSGDTMQLLTLSGKFKSDEVVFLFILASRFSPLNNAKLRFALSKPFPDLKIIKTRESL